MRQGKVDPGVSELSPGNELSRDHVNMPQMLCKRKTWNRHEKTVQMLISCSGIFKRFKSFWHDYFFLNFVLQLSDNSVLVFVIFPHSDT